MKKLFNLDKDLLEKLTNRTNRSRRQTMFLFELLEGDFNKLLILEEKLKNNHLSFCPDSIDEVNGILNSVNKFEKWFSLSEFRNN
jgi:hypothetical protein